MTFTAIRPDFGLSKGRDVSLRRVDQASAWISASSVVPGSPGLVNDRTEVPIHPAGPEVLVLRTIEIVELRPWIRGVQLEIEGSRLDSLLLLARQPGEAVREGFSDPELHKALASAARPARAALEPLQPAPESAGIRPASLRGRSRALRGCRAEASGTPPPASRHVSTGPSPASRRFTQGLRRRCGSPRTRASTPRGRSRGRIHYSR